MLLRKRNRKGQSLVEYGILIGGVALVALAAVSIFGHKTTDLIGTVAAALPGAHADDNNAIVSGKLVQTATIDAGGVTAIVLDVGNPGSLTNNYGFTGTNNLVVEP